MRKRLEHTRTRIDAVVQPRANSIAGNQVLAEPHIANPILDQMAMEIIKGVYKLLEDKKGRKTVERAADMLANSLGFRIKPSEITETKVAEMAVLAIQAVLNDFDRILGQPEGTMIEKYGVEMAKNDDLLRSEEH